MFLNVGISFDDRQPCGEQVWIFFKLLTTHPPSLTFCDEGLAILILDGIANQAQNSCHFSYSIINQKTVVQTWL